MTGKAPGQYHRKGLTLFELQRMFPTDQVAKKWVENIRWQNGIECPHCQGSNIQTEVTHKTMDYRCRSCRKWFSVRTGTLMQKSKLPILYWVYAVYIQTYSLKSMASMKLYRELGITQKTAWYLSHRIRKSWEEGTGLFSGPVEVDETFVGGKEANKHEHKKLKAGRGGVGKTAVVGIKDRQTNKVKAKVVQNTKKPTLQGYVKDNINPGAETFTDDNRSYQGLDNHKTVCHSVGEYVNGQIHTNGIESFWSMLKRSHKGIFHKMSPKHLQRYVDEFSGRHNLRSFDTEDMMRIVFTQMGGKDLSYQELIKNNGLDNGARKV